MSPAMLWLIAGGILCVMEAILPTAFMEFVLGVSAIAVGLLLLALPQISFGVQIVLWITLSVCLTLLVRRFMPRRTVYQIEDSVEARTLTDIPVGEAGRVLYEGNSWAAQCADERMAIAPNQKVYVVHRKGNTLFVLPEDTVRN